MSHHFSIEANLVDVHNKEIYPAKIEVLEGIITSITKTESTPKHYILPGFVDSHVHIESSLLIPSEFARMAVIHGTVATVSDPHEIANVCGMEGIKYMIDNGKQVPFKFFFGAPSCVPATTFETAGAVISPEQVDELLQQSDILYLSEMMNYPGVLFDDKDVMSKIASAKKHGKPVDGHAPGLRGADLDKYISAGISTDHECFTYQEGLEKIQKGMKVLIREGSAAKNFEALIDLLSLYPNEVMFCSDDKHPDALQDGHINQLVARAVKHGVSVMDAIRAATINPVQHYKLPVGLLRVGDEADFILCHDLKNFDIEATYIKGLKVASHHKTHIKRIDSHIINNFHKDYKEEFEIEVEAKSAQIRVINVIEGQLITSESIENANIIDGKAESNPETDILKLVVVNRYNQVPPGVAFVKNFGLKTGAIASTVAHDSHNIIAIGVTDSSIIRAINLLVDCGGGLSVVDDKDVSEPFYDVLPLPVAGLMSNQDAWEVSNNYKNIDSLAKQLGTHLKAPYMTLSFLALLVIPDLKLSDKGLFSGKTFSFSDLFV